MARRVSTASIAAGATASDGYKPATAASYATTGSLSEKGCSDSAIATMKPVSTTCRTHRPIGPIRLDDPYVIYRCASRHCPCVAWWRKTRSALRERFKEDAEVREVATSDLHPGLTSCKEAICFLFAALSDKDF